MPLLEEEEETLLFHSSLIQSSLFLLLPRFRQPSSPFSSPPPHTYLQPTSSGLPLPPQSNHGRHHLPFPISALLSPPFFSFPLHLFLTHLLVEVTEKRGEGGKRGERPSLTQLSQLQHPKHERGGGRRTMPAECACFTNKLFASSLPFPFLSRRLLDCLLYVGASGETKRTWRFHRPFFHCQAELKLHAAIFSRVLKRPLLKKVLTHKNCLTLFYSSTRHTPSFPR